MQDATEIELELDHETDDAYIMWDGDDEVTLPKSLVEIELMKDTLYLVTLPQWLAEDRGLV